MGQIENMRPEDVEAIEDFIKERNTQIEEVSEKMRFKTFPMEDLEFSKRITALEEKIDLILTKVSNIFGDYVLINGRFIDLKQMACEKCKSPTIPGS